MPLVAPLNDQPCLSQVHCAAEEFSRTPVAQELARQFRDRHQVVRFIRHKPQRDDHGDPTDGPRIQCDVSQRMRLDPDDPNCFDREHREQRAERIRQELELEPEPGAAKNPATPEQHRPDPSEIQARLRRMTFASLQPDNRY